MKKLHFACVALSLAAVAAPAGAQTSMSASYEFIKAVKNRDGNKATQLLSSNPPGLINIRGDDGDTALNIALARRDDNWVAFLISKGADVNRQGKAGDTPLIIAARLGYEDAIDWLLDRGAKVDSTNRMGETPLVVAVQQRQVPIVRLLLAAGANPDKTDTAAGLSARDYAARDTRSRQILQLIEAKKPKTSAAAQ